MHRVLKIEASPAQLSKLRNGRSVRVKRGTGFNLIVHPETYSLATRAFSKNKGIELSLSPEELEANENPEIYTPAIEEHHEMEDTPISGGSIFGKKFDRMLKRKIGTKGTKTIHEVGRIAKPYVKAAMREALKKGQEAMSERYPEYAPLFEETSDELAIHGDRFIDKGHKSGKGIRSGIVSSVPHAMSSKLSRAGVDKALANASSAGMISDSVKSRYHASRPASLNAGGPLNVGMGFHHSRMEHGSIGRGAGMLQSQPVYSSPALESQPLGANFQMRFFLPPQYQIHGNGMSGVGLYAGHSGRGIFA